MKDFFEQEIQIGDRCIRYTGQLGGLEEVIVLGEDKKGIKILNFMDKEVYTQGHKLFDFSAYERKIQEEKIFNSIKALEVKPNDVVIASLIPNQMSMKKAESIFKQMMQIFPDNQVSLVMGLDVTNKKGEECNDCKTI